jgi:allophanate hydrolase
MQSLAIGDLLTGYAARRFTPDDVVNDVLAGLETAPKHNIWITRLNCDQVLSYVRALDGKDPQNLPLYGVPFAIKDNIDLAGIPTTAACPEYGYVPQRSATVVQKLIAAGAIPIGKTNLDQFATGLVGTRSPYGAGRNAFNPEFISGGSSSGSALAVAMGLVSFSLGTDTAGSGRVPAAFNNLIGLKPSCGLVSTHGVMPACRSLDCVSVFSLTASDARQVLRVVEGFDPLDDYSRVVARRAFDAETFRFGVPRTDQLQFFGDSDYAKLFDAAVIRLQGLGGQRVEIDFEPFLDTARLLYEGPWVAERYAAIADFIARRPQALHPVTQQIISGATQRHAVETFQAQYRLQALRRQVAAVWNDIDVLLTPTAGTVYRITDLESDPIRLNTDLGYYTNFMNLLDLAAVAIPAGFRADGLPFGATLAAPAGSDEALLRLAGRAHDVESYGCGNRLPIEACHSMPTDVAPGFIAIAVCGAHMRGLPLNHQLTARGGYFVRTDRSAACYRLYVLPGGPPARPGMMRVATGGSAIELEIWALPEEQMGSFLTGIPAPLGLGKVLLADQAQVTGFVCESHAAADAQDITELGGWRAYLQQR